VAGKMQHCTRARDEVEGGAFATQHAPAAANHPWLPVRAHTCGDATDTLCFSNDVARAIRSLPGDLTNVAVDAVNLVELRKHLIELFGH